ncbi:alkaline phosphatase D family protein [Glaciecola siphonariae]|uniref:Alkaline phosphatase D family protein n=1 Tax=Glaciecola siphonariae TaxID=521012 RepID=A0ABV9LYU3_9ALTE
MSNLTVPTLIAGPMLRHVACDIVTVWLVTSTPMAIRLHLHDSKGHGIALNESDSEHLQFCVGQRCYIHLIRAVPQHSLTEDAFYSYNLSFDEKTKPQATESQACSLSLNELSPSLFNENETNICFFLARSLRNIAHGSCRKAHFHKADALPTLDDFIKVDKDTGGTNSNYPDLLLLTGDQVYVDDVAGPMLHAIGQVIEHLGLFGENFDASVVKDTDELFSHEHSFYERELLFPEINANEDLTKVFIKAKRKPVFTSVNAHNHLIALNEIIALYLLSWSSKLWPLITLDKPNLAAQYVQRYADERVHIEHFAEGLEKVERVFAHVPTYMIFDDHDVTDDWNLTRGWEEQVYANPFSRRIVGNALSAYFLCQGLGNPIDKIRPLVEKAKLSFNDTSSTHESFIDAVFEFSEWHYHLDTSPPIHVLDTRTQRWRSESNKNKPSGLMDWEGLCELQQNIIGNDSVIMVSAAPVYGVKFIEAIQRIFTTFGGALMVDAENWMAHRGTASVMLNIFRHIKTPPNFIILSGDVHYSFVYDVSLRFRRNSPKILQFTCSGLHNEFPDALLTWFERFNRWLYGHRSPLNWLTKRRNMSVKQRHPQGSERDVVNACSFGLLQLGEDGQETACKVICSDGREVIFKPSR